MIRLVNQLLSKAMIDIPLRGWGITALLLIAKKLLHFVKKYLVYISIVQQRVKEGGTVSKSKGLWSGGRKQVQKDK